MESILLPPQNASQAKAFVGSSSFMYPNTHEMTPPDSENGKAPLQETTADNAANSTAVTTKSAPSAADAAAVDSVSGIVPTLQ